MISAQGLSLSYSGHERELDDLNFTVARGEFVSIVGPSGCGKSSLLRIIAGVVTPSGGSVVVSGKTEGARPADVGFVPQDGLLLPWRTVLANVALPLILAGQTTTVAEKRAAELLSLVGAADKASRYPATLSGGERQRVAVARALAGEHPLLLLDEPFASLDAVTREELNLFLQEIWMRTGTTILFVTHNIHEAVFLADRVLILGERPGRLLGTVCVELPRPRQLSDLERPELSALAGRIRRIMMREGASHAD